MITLMGIVFVAGFVWVLCVLFSKPSSKLYILDKPNERSLHVVAKPRSGGIAICIVLLITFSMVVILLDVENYLFYFLIGLVLLSFISYCDDKYSVSQSWRLFVHFIAAILLIVGGLGYSGDLYIHEQISLKGVAFNFSIILFIVWSINLYNFMDGIDGLAGGMGVIGFACFACLGWWSGNDLFGFMAAIIAAANLGFLTHNFPPAKLFMGDVGSISMGYLVAFFSLWGIGLDLFSWWTPVLIFSPFFVDSTFTLIVRLLRREKFWEAHKSHCYQRVVQSGWGHKKTVVYEYILMASAALSSIAMNYFNSPSFTMFLVSLWVITFTVIIYFVRKLKDEV